MGKLMKGLTALAAATFVAVPFVQRLVDTWTWGL
jgi:hypothetical protein